MSNLHGLKIIILIVYFYNVSNTATTTTAAMTTMATTTTTHTYIHTYNPIPHIVNPYPTAFPYGNGMVLHFYQQQESSTTKTVHKVINRGLKTYV